MGYGRDLLSWFLIFSIYFPLNVFAEETSKDESKGILFSIGEWFIKQSGHSYEDVEERYVGCVKNNDSIRKVKKDIKAKHLEQVKVGDIPIVDGRSIRMNMFELLATGCKGNLKMVNERYKLEEGDLTPKKEEIVTEFESTYDKRFRELAFQKLTVSNVVKTRITEYQNKIEVNLGERLSHSKNYPTVVLDEPTKIEFEKSGGTLEKGEYKYSYTVTKNEDKSLKVEFEGKTAEVWNHMDVGRKTSFAFVATCPSLEQLEQNSINEQSKSDTLKLREAIFEDK